ncbi:MAG: excinuclease ABC subunit A, partial [Planctomycetaceae bacterium]|nr:excinuclease ABC subunit A [Planctomycetaceae bacterium]
IDLGPEAGEQGGHVVAAGTPEEIVQQGTGDGKKGRGKAKNERRKIEASSSDHATSLRSYTAEALAPVLAAGPYAERKPYDFAAAEAARDEDRELTDMGGGAKMPWETDGRRWHTVDRVGRTGNPCRWSGRVLSEVVDRIQQKSELFAETDWSARSVVEVRAAKKSDGWFFHAITGEEWLLKMKFRTSRHTFDRDLLVEQLQLKPLNDMPELPLYGTEPRVRCKNLRGPWQEIELRVHSYEEIDRPEFWDFVDRAVAGFAKFTEKIQEKSDILQPWKQLGRVWHFARKGFTLGKKIYWDAEVLEDLMELLADVAPKAQFLWNNKQVVPVFVPERRDAWAAVQTKRRDAVYLHLMGPKGRFPLGCIADLGRDPELDGHRPGVDVIRLKFRTTADLGNGDLRKFLKEHLASGK